MTNEFERPAGHYDRAAFLRRGAALGASLGLAGTLSRHAFARAEGATLNLVAYSTPKSVMTQIESAWAQTAQGSGVSFAQSFGPSTSQAQAVAAGQPADIVFFSWPGDVQLLVDAGLVNPNWDEQSYNGIVADTVVVFALRDGNPKKILHWTDLIKPGVQVITPDPFSSGSAKWNILAAYAAQRHLGKTDAAGHRLRQGALQERRRPAHLGHQRHRRLPRRRRRRPAHLRERSDQRQPKRLRTSST